MCQQKQSLSVWIYFQDPVNLPFWSPCPRRPHPHGSTAGCLSISMQFFSTVAPEIFCKHNSPSILTHFQYPRPPLKNNPNFSKNGGIFHGGSASPRLFIWNPPTKEGGGFLQQNVVAKDLQRSHANHIAGSVLFKATQWFALILVTVRHKQFTLIPPPLKWRPWTFPSRTETFIANVPVEEVTGTLY